MSLATKDPRPVRPLYVDMKRDDEGHWYWRVRCGRDNSELARGAADQIAKAYTDVTVTLTDLAHGTGKFAKEVRHG